MPTCSDCALYTKKTGTEGECSINGHVPTTRVMSSWCLRAYRHTVDAAIANNQC